MTFEPDPERDIRIESKYDAWREKAEFDFALDVSYGYIEEQVREAIDGRPEDSARAYLGTYRDAVTERVQHTIDEAEALLAAGHHGPATSLAATAVELTVRDLVIRPLVQGAFLSDQWAATLTNHILRGAPGEVRRLLPVIATAWGLDLDEVRLADGAGVWGIFTGPVSQARNAFVHRAGPRGSGHRMRPDPSRRSSRPVGPTRRHELAGQSVAPGLRRRRPHDADVRATRPVRTARTLIGITSTVGNIPQDWVRALGSAASPDRLARIVDYVAKQRQTSCVLSDPTRVFAALGSCRASGRSHEPGRARPRLQEGLAAEAHRVVSRRRRPDRRTRAGTPWRLASLRATARG